MLQNSSQVLFCNALAVCQITQKKQRHFSENNFYRPDKKNYEHLSIHQVKIGIKSYLPILSSLNYQIFSFSKTFSRVFKHFVTDQQFKNDYVCFLFVSLLKFVTALSTWTELSTLENNNLFCHTLISVQMSKLRDESGV